MMAGNAEINGKTMTEILEEVVEGEEVIFESEDVGNGEDGEVEEIVEIIEEIVEEVEEDEVDEEAIESHQKQIYCQQEEEAENLEEEYLEEFEDVQKRRGTREECSEKERVDEYIKDNFIENGQAVSMRRVKNRVGNGLSKGEFGNIVAYHVEEDWEDEELEQGNNHIDADNSRTEVEYDHHTLSNADSESQDEIVKNAENNLVYTVLNPKKSSTVVRPNHNPKYQESDFIKMERMEDEPICYEGGDLDALYVNNETIVETPNQQQYEFADVSMENAQDWEPEQSAEPAQEDSNQDQIFLHEDEDGQLYFKDDTGTLQPVYLTEDGNYAIAGTGNEEPEVQEPQQEIMEEDKQDEETNYIPQMDFSRQVTSKKTSIVTASNIQQEMDNEDSTVTISLIISEDEHGQKRTQVIIPTAENTKCEICNKNFKTSLQLLKHNRLKHAREEDITTRNFPCDLCPKRYPDQNSLARHRKTHTGDRPFQCLECHKCFPSAPTLRRHLSLHNPNSKPLPCIYCGRRFLEQANLDKHELSHRAAEQRHHACDVCHKTFVSSVDLSIHLKTHDPDRKFDCEVCGREFNRVNNLQRHMMVHQQQGESEEVLACEVCGITYKFMSSLTRHMVTTHMNPEKLRQQAEEQRKKRENNYKRYLENRRLYETQRAGGYISKRSYYSSRSGDDQDEHDQV
ncbi:zinc finger protein 570-like isoform X1 [Leptopilina heterotoma]|uniref:zinc finger protein 570-like isoform X1 n=1 Tax=Leptopilina heterotoma TaxID=63436 RepID=UPI001CA924AF|nr:zinc finger protein 570-like isoform X1 [Leptopilina heterotoma]XP_043476207.1 zinc finger protein 570-like isoform X1 [Leptopilina heterotoma]XP_043476208.1 zinc finger protein 570-like isoform X1 [Leptopilina heterotoma]